MNLIQQ